MDEIIAGIILLFSGVLLVLGLVCSSSAFKYYYSGNYTVQVTSDKGKVVYTGRAACVNVKSAGSAAKVIIYKPTLWCIGFQEKAYVGNYVLTTLGEDE